MKRKATTQLTKEGWEQQLEAGSNYEEQEIDVKEDTPEEISKRKIFRAKRAAVPTGASSQGKFQLVGSLTALHESGASSEGKTTIEHGEANGEQRSIESNQSSANGESKQMDTSKPEEQKVVQKDEVNQKNENAAKSGDDPAKQNPYQFEFGKPLFGATNTAPVPFPTSTFFGNKPIFGTGAPTGTFGASPLLTGFTNPFQNTGFGTFLPNTSGTGTSMTSFLSTGTKPVAEDNAESSGDEQPIRSNSPTSLRQGDDKQESNSPYTKLYNKPIEKIRVNNDSRGNGVLAIETCELNGKAIVLLVFRNTLGSTLYQGSLLQGLTGMKKQLGKGIKIQLQMNAVSKKPDGKLSMDQLLITFTRDSERTDFGQTVKKAMELLGPASEKKDSVTSEKRDSISPSKNDRVSPMKERHQEEEKQSPSKRSSSVPVPVKESAIPESKTPNKEAGPIAE